LLAQDQISERSGEGTTIIEFSDAIGRIVHRCAGVEQKIGAQVGFVFVFFDEIAIEFSQRLPIDAPNLVARRIFAMLFELYAEPFGAAAMDAGHDTFHHPSRPQ
jgi:hypothetical protein